jgi:hypothetical protein
MRGYLEAQSENIWALHLTVVPEHPEVSILYVQLPACPYTKCVC